jgi:uncharacterized membrane protein YhaH (DUF805 family)
MKEIFLNWFSLEHKVSRKFYLLSGVGLMIFKYTIEAMVYFLIKGHFLSPFSFLSPLISSTYHKELLSLADVTVLFIFALWNLPFIWIGISMSIRRAWDAGKSPWLGLLFLAPFFKYFIMCGLSLLPAREYRFDTSLVREPAKELGKIATILISTSVAILISIFMIGISIYIFGDYGTNLFYTTPFILGLCIGYISNRSREISFSQTASYTVFGIICSGCVILLFALEGIICMAMALPIVLIASLMGSFVGRFLVMHRHFRKHAMYSVAFLPLFAFIESNTVEPEVFEVITGIQINASPETVWENVIGFSEIKDAPGFILSSGIAYPLRARIEGSGVGAIRYCEFTTGPFVEPITAWEPAKRLAFDVKEHPPAMQEWSPYRDISPPHLDGYFKSQRGEFRLSRNPDGTTYLEGSTWYSLKIYPHIYWKLLTHSLLHHIHTRVLTQVKNLSEAE